MRQSDAALQAVLECANHVKNGEFFSSLVSFVAKKLNVKYCFVGNYLAEPAPQIETVAFFQDGNLNSNFKYDLLDTPCADVMASKLALHSQNIVDEFPEDHLLEEMNIQCYLGMPLLDANRKPIGILVIMHDEEAEKLIDEMAFLKALSAISAVELEKQHLIENLKKSKELAEHSSLIKDQFLANVSHEIRTPLSVILGYAEKVNSSDWGPEQQNLAASAIKRNSFKLLNLFTDIVDLTRLVSDQMSVKNKEIDIKSLVQDIHANFASDAAQKNLELKIELHELNAPTIATDNKQLSQILTHLLRNALKFTKDGQVTFKVYEQDSKTISNICFEITDTGIGINPENLDKIFDPFWQSEEFLTRQNDGLGIGLAISKKLATLLGGHLSVQSQPNVGSIFLLKLPQKRVLSDSGSPTSSPRALKTVKTDNDVSAPGRKKRILIAEDVTDIRFLMTTHLLKLGYEVDEASNGLEAVEAVTRRRKESIEFDLILLDIQMPVMDGMTAFKQLKILDNCPPVALLTAHAMPEDLEKFKLAGVEDIITKPITRDLFTIKIRELLG